MTCTDAEPRVRLIEPRALGFEIPASTYLRVMASVGLRRALAAPPTVLAYGQAVPVSATADHRRGMVADLGMPRWFRQEIGEAYRALGQRVPVRVSRAGERACHATPVVGEDAVADAVVAIWSSLWTEEVCARQVDGCEEPAVTVLVEPLPANGGVR